MKGICVVATARGERGIRKTVPVSSTAEELAEYAAPVGPEH